MDKFFFDLGIANPSIAVVELHISPGRGIRTDHKTYSCLMPKALTQVVAINRDDRIRTCGPFVPNEVRYQAA
ncbi:MAG TPA: hypothetical protein ACN46S_02115, partial [Prochlorococcus sp.]